MQVDRKNYPTIVNSLKYIYNNKGLRSLFQGATSPMLSSSFTTSISFLSYSKSLSLTNSIIGDQKYLNNFISGTVSGLVTGIVFCPFEVVKIKLQTQTNFEFYKGNLDCLKKILQKEKVPGLFKGLKIKLWTDMPGVGIYFASYEFFKKEFGISPILAGGFAGVI